MASSPNQPSKSEEDTTKRLDLEVRDMVATLTQRLTQLHSNPLVGPSNLGTDTGYVEDDENGIRVLTLAGTNTGATMRADFGDKLSDNLEVPGTYANSNCQALNNSIMMNGSYIAEDPGVHIFISEYDEEEEQGKGEGKHKEKKKKEHKKEKKASDDEE